jgi:MYXO-CTERM domain-containing protein
MPHPLVLHWYAEPAPTGGYDYAFSLVVDEPLTGNVDGIVFADVGNAAPSDADALVNVSLIGSAPLPFTALEFANGTHAGPLFENHPSTGWTPGAVGDHLDWNVHADELAEVLYWSTTRGDAPLAEFELAINDCALASVAPTADRYQGLCVGMVKDCDPVSHAFVEPDYTAITGFEDVEATCDTLDNDCNDVVDDVADPPLADVQAGVCAEARKVCASGDWVEPDYTALAEFEASEVTCDGEDNDCDGAADAADAESGIAGVLSPRQDGVCAGSLMTCDGSGGLVEPEYTAIEGYEAVEVSCDLLDNDCNGAADEVIECAEITTGCGCSSSSASGWSLAAAGLLWTARRRR